MNIKKVAVLPAMVGEVFSAKRLFRFGAVMALAVGFVTVLTLASSPAGAGHVSPDLVDGNPKCTDFGYDYGFKPEPEPPPNGTYTIPGTTKSVTITNTGTGTFDWTSTVGIDAVIVKGGNNANVYKYDPPAESFGDTGLSTPINSNSGKPFAISHIDFCIDWEVDVSKTANAEFTRTWTWTINKTADTASLNLSPGQTHTVNYRVDVDASKTDSDWKATGEIQVKNDTPFSTTVTSVSDIVSGAVSATVTCPVTLPTTLAPAGTLLCTYSAALPDGVNRMNTATVATNGKVGGGVGTAEVVFGEPTTEVDEQISVTDDRSGYLGAVKASEAPKSFEYAGKVGPFTDQQCGNQEVKNTATFTTNDTPTTGDSTWTVNVFVDCPSTGGCTLTQGYWKTHSDKGPAPYDDTWALLGGSSAMFLASGQSYFDVMWTAPQGGNAWYILAHQYIAADLNRLNGADVSAIQTALDNAKTTLMRWDADGPDTKGENLIPRGSARNAAISLAATLANYNEGVTGPGHCDE